MEKTQKMNSSILKIEDDYSNSQFSKATIRIMYEGHNRNGSYMVGDVINAAVKNSLSGVPIIGYYSDESEDFTDHATEIKFNEDSRELEYKSYTVPYGFIPAEATTHWEEVEEYDGRVNNYLVVEGAILWSGRYPEVGVLTKESRNHSMEININNGREAIIDGLATFEVTEFEFTGLCILSNQTEPCFESSKISSFSLEEAKFKEEFKAMLFELKQETNNTEGGNEVSKKKQEEVFETEAQEDVTETTEAEFENVEEQTEVASTETEDFAKDKDEDESEKSEEAETDEPDDEDEPDEEDKKKKYEAEDSDEGEETLDLVEFLHGLQKDNEGLKEEFAKFKSEFEALEAEYDELKAYRHKRESEDLRSTFGSQITDEEFAEVLAANEDLSVVEEKLYALIGKKTYAFESSEAKSNKQKLAPVSTNSNVITSPYGDIFEK